jgi:hypothetical protein
MVSTERHIDGLRRFLKRVRLWNVAVILYVLLSWLAIFVFCVLFRQFIISIMR